MSDDDDAVRRPPVGNRTIQIDALTDVQLVDNVLADAASVAPPPLPKRNAGPSRARVLGLTFVAVIAGVAVALAAVHFLFPATPTAPAAETPEVVAPAVHRVQLDDELVIHAGDSPAP